MHHRPCARRCAFHQTSPKRFRYCTSAAFPFRPRRSRCRRRPLTIHHAPRRSASTSLVSTQWSMVHAVVATLTVALRAAHEFISRRQGGPPEGFSAGTPGSPYPIPALGRRWGAAKRAKGALSVQAICPSGYNTLHACHLTKCCPSQLPHAVSRGSPSSLAHSQPKPGAGEGAPARADPDGADPDGLRASFSCALANRSMATRCIRISLTTAARCSEAVGPLVTVSSSCWNARISFTLQLSDTSPSSICDANRRVQVSPAEQRPYTRPERGEQWLRGYGQEERVWATWRCGRCNARA